MLIGTHTTCHFCVFIIIIHMSSARMQNEIDQREMKPKIPKYINKLKWTNNKIPIIMKMRCRMISRLFKTKIWRITFRMIIILLRKMPIRSTSIWHFNIFIVYLHVFYRILSEQGFEHQKNVFMMTNYTWNWYQFRRIGHLTTLT